MSTPLDDLELARRAEQLYRRIQSEKSPNSDLGSDLPTGVGPILHLLATLQVRNSPTDQEDRGSHDVSQEAEFTIGRFRLLQYLGEGAHGVVYLADDTLLDRIVALKLPKPHVFFTPDLRRRFLREARAASKLHHPHIVQIYDASEADELNFIASEYCSGGALSKWLNVEGNRLTSRNASSLVADLSDAVSHAHQNGILHRDIKPSNIQLSPVEHPADPRFPFIGKIADFGLAKALASDERQTKTGELIGTIRYMAPELILGKGAASPASDVYGLGVVLYELLCGQAPFNGTSELAIYRKITDTQPINSSCLCDVPADLAAICMKSMERDVERRYASAADLAADLRRFLAGEPTAARPMGRIRKMTRWANRNPALAGLCGIILIGVFLGLIGLAYHNQRLNRAFEALSAQKDVSDRAREDSDRNAALAEQRAGLLTKQQQKIISAAYASDMNSAFHAFGAHLPRLTKKLLDQHDYSARQKLDSVSFDPRGFEWSFLKRMINPNQTVLCEGLHSPHLAISAFTDSLVIVSQQDSSKVVELKHFEREYEFPNLGQSREVAVCHETGRMALSHQGENDEWQITIFSATGEIQSTFGNHKSTIETLVFSNSGEFIASGSRYSDIVISKPNGERVAKIENASRNEAIAFSPDDHLFAFSAYENETDTDSVNIVDTQSWSVVAKLPLFRKDEVLCFSPDGSHLLVSSHYQIKAYSTENFQCRQVIHGARGRVSGMTYSRDGSLLVAATTDGVLRWWECELNANRTQVHGADPLGIRSTGAVMIHDGRINSVSIGGHRQVFTSGNDGRVVCTELPCGTQLLSAECNGHSAVHLRVSHRGHVMTALSDGRDVIVSPDGKQTVLQNDVAQDDSISWLRRIAFSPNSNQVASFYGNHVSIFSFDSSTPRFQQDIDGTPLMDIEFVENKLLAIVQEDQPYVELWTTDGVKRKRLSFPGIVLRIEVVPSSKIMVVGFEGDQATSGELCLYDWDREQIVHRIPYKEELISLALSGDGSVLAAGNRDGIVNLYRMPTLRHIATIDSQLTQRMLAIAFSDDGKTVATGGTRGRLQLWQVETGRCLGTLFDNSSVGIVGVDIQPEGAIVCAFLDGATPVLRIAP